MCITSIRFQEWKRINIHEGIQGKPVTKIKALLCGQTIYTGGTPIDRIKYPGAGAIKKFSIKNRFGIDIESLKEAQ